MSKESGLDGKVLRRVFRYVKPYRAQFVLALFLTILGATIGPLRPLIIGDMIKAYVAGQNSFLIELGDKVSIKHEDGFLFWTLVVIGSLFIEGIISFYSTYMSSWLGQSIIRDIRTRLFRKISSFKLKYYDNTPIGSLVTRVISDIEAIADIFSQGILTIFSELLRVVIVLVFMFTTSWELSLLCLIPLPIMFIATRMFARAMKKAFQQERVQVNRLNTFVQEHITGMNIVQIFNREKEEMSKFEDINKAHRQAHINAVWAFSIFVPFVEFLSALSIAILVIYGVGTYEASGSAAGDTFGLIFKFTLWIFMLFRPIRQLADRFNVLQRGVVRADRVFKVMDEDATIIDEGDYETNGLEGHVVFDKVKFAYVDEDWVLKGIDFEVQKGETVAFVGATGAGKSTIINLLSRFYEFQEGSILIDGHDIRSYKLSNLRRNIAFVPQDVFLFSDTIHNNITLNDPNISREQVIEASKAVNAHDFIMRLPGNYDFNVRERGGMLSVGQRQLLSFIRAYVYNPSVLILDEATSSIDTESEELIQHATEKLTQGRTSIIIAHRLSTIQNADRIYVMDQGKIIESGSHSQLLEQGGQYSRLYDLQFS